MRDEDPGGAALLAAYPLARRQARRLAGERADDLAQDAFLRVYTVRHRYATDDLAKILSVAVQRVWTDHQRQAARRPTVPLPAHWLTGEPHDREAPMPDSLTYRTTPEVVVVLADERARVRALLATLSAADQQALDDCYWHGRTQSGDPTFKSQVQRAGKRFARAWVAAA